MKKLFATLMVVAAFTVGGVTAATAADAAIGFQSPSVDQTLKMGNWPH